MPATLLDAPRGTDTLPRPRARATVRRPRLESALGGHGAPPFVALVAPAGYGKTTLLAEWCAHDPRPSVWLTLERRHDDPWFLLSWLARAVDSAEAPILLVLDDVHKVRSAAARETIASLALQPPDGTTIAFASREALPLPVSRLRAEGLVAELGARELAMTRSEAALMCRLAGLQLDHDELDTLLRRTEGWPAGLSLAVLSLRDQPVPGPALRRFGGGDRLIAEYVRDEILAERSADELEFVLRTSVLDVLTAPLCDALLERTGSAGVLARLQRSGFPLVELDRSGERVRHHRLLADMLRAELGRSEPRLEARLHRRASGWHAHAGDREHALRHALAAGEIAGAGALIWAGVPNALEHGTSAKLEHWLDLFTSAQVAANPQLALVAAGTRIAYGQGDVAGHWISAAATAGGEAAAGAVTALRAALARDGLGRMASDASRAAALLPADSPCQALCNLVTGVAQHLRGMRAPARRALEDGARRAAVSAPQLQALCLAQLALLALDEGDREGAARAITRARAQVARHGLDRYPTTALVLAVSALVRAQRGRVDDARADLDGAAGLAQRLTDLAPWYEIEVEIVLARAALRLSDVNTARSTLAAAARLTGRASEAPVLHDWLRQAQADLDGYTSAANDTPAALTTAELRILRFLPTHLSFREIADRAHVSPNTVKTQAYAVYRKFDVGSRSDAVERGRQLGLID